MLEEGNETSCDRNELFRGNIHVINPAWINFDELPTLTRSNALVKEATLLVNRIVSLSNEISLFLVSSKIFNRIGHLALFHNSIRSLDESELVNTCVGAHRVNESNVRAFRSLNRTNPTIVRSVNISDLKTSTITIESTRSKCRKTALVSKLGEWVGLVHELRKLRPTEEVANNRTECLRVNKLLWRHPLNIDIKESHTLFNQTFGAGETNTTLIGKKFANSTDSS